MNNRLFILSTILIALLIVVYYNYIGSKTIQSAVDSRGLKSPIQSGAGIIVTEAGFVQSPSNQYTLSWFNTENGFAPMIFYPNGRAHILPVRYKRLDQATLMWDENNRILIQETDKPQIIFELKNGLFHKI